MYGYFFRSRRVITVEQFRNKRFASSMLATLPSPPGLQIFFRALDTFAKKLSVSLMKITLNKLRARIGVMFLNSNQRSVMVKVEF